MVILSGIFWFEAVVGLLYHAIDLKRRNSAVVWSRLDKFRIDYQCFRNTLGGLLGEFLLFPKVLQ
jgi:hypothetical protein